MRNLSIVAIFRTIKNAAIVVFGVAIHILNYFFGIVAARDTGTASSLPAVEQKILEKRSQGTDRKMGGTKPKKRLVKPQEPLPEACCGSGCERCVWDVYYEALEKYEAAVAGMEPSEKEDT